MDKRTIFPKTARILERLLSNVTPNERVDVFEDKTYKIITRMYCSPNIASRSIRDEVGGVVNFLLLNSEYHNIALSVGGKYHTDYDTLTIVETIYEEVL